MHQRNDGALAAVDDGKTVHELCLLCRNHLTSGCDLSHMQGILLRDHVKNPRRKRGRQSLERETGFEPATSTLARSHSTTELLPPNFMSINDRVPAEQTWRSQRAWGEPTTILTPRNVDQHRLIKLSRRCRVGGGDLVAYVPEIFVE